jgi:hypothetical protein
MFIKEIRGFSFLEKYHLDEGRKVTERGRIWTVREKK